MHKHMISVATQKHDTQKYTIVKKKQANESITPLEQIDSTPKGM